MSKSADDCPPIFYNAPFGHDGLKYGESTLLPLHTRTTITAPSDSDGEFTLKTTTKRTAKEIAEQRLLYQKVSNFPAGDQDVPQNCMVLLHREICGNSLSPAPGFVDGDFTGKDLVVVLPSHLPKYPESEILNRDHHAFDDLRYALNDLRNLNVFARAQSITFTTSGDFNPRLANFVNDYCQQFGIDAGHLAIMAGESQEEAFHEKCGYFGKKEDSIPVRKVRPDELKIILARKVSLRDTLVPDPSVAPIEGEKSQDGAKSPEL